MNRIHALLIASTLALTASPAWADANHTERKWMVLETEHFSVHYYQGESRVARRVALAAEEVLPKIARDFGVSIATTGKHPFAKVPIVVDYDSFFNGDAEPIKDRIHLDPALASSSVMGGKRFIAHELTHIITFLAVDKNGVMSKLANVEAMPRWFLEGLAQYEGEYWYPSNDRMLRLHTLDDTLLSNSARENFPILDNEAGAQGYDEGYSLTAYLFDTYGRDKLAKMMKLFRDGQVSSLDQAVKQVTGQTMAAVRAGWLEHIRQKYRLQTLDMKAEVPGSHAVVRTAEGDANIRPELSPDGKHLAYLTSRREDGYLYLRGHVMGFLSLAVASPDGKNPHLLRAGHDRISSYTWSPDGQQLVYSAVCMDPKTDDPTFDLFLTDRSGQKVKQLTHVMGATDPAWRPGTDEVAFVQNEDDRAKLEEVDVKTGKIRDMGVSLGDRQIADLAWNPDGKLLAVSTYMPGQGGKIALIDPDKGTIEPLTSGGSRIDENDPVWSPDGKAVVFASTREHDMQNLFEFTLATHQLRQLTDIYTGAGMPTFTRNGKDLLWTDYCSTGSEIRMAPVPVGTLVAYKPPGPLAMNLSSKEARVAGPGAPAGPDPRWTVHPYQPTMTTDLIVPEVTSDERGEQVGVAAMYSDILEKQQLGLDVRFGLMSQRFSYQASYTNSMLPHTWQLSVFDQPTIGIPDQIVPSDLNGSLYWERQRGIGAAVQLGQFTLSSQFSYLNALTQPLEPGLTTRQGRLDSLSLGWSEEKLAPTFDQDINPSGGYAVAANYTIADHSLGSDFDFSNVSLEYDRFIPVIPDLRHNLTLSAEVGLNQGDAPPLFLGGTMGGGSLTALRGYDAGQFAGNRMVRLGAEYTLPISTHLDYALGPLYFDKLYVSAFAETGDAWQSGQAPTFHSSYGAELRLRLALGGSQVVVLHFGVAHPVGGSSTDWYPYISF